MKTATLPFFQPAPEPLLADKRLPTAARVRLSKQCRAILARLREGPATNRELAQLALKYTSRLSDLRLAGYRVEVIAHDHASGLVRYALRAEP